jgi:hypothetical protein
MRVAFKTGWFVLCLVLCLADCKQVYDPPPVKAGNNYLVVDGVINIGAGSVTSINLNRTRNLSDSTKVGIPELHAQMAIVASGGASYPLQDNAGKGVYSSQPLSLDISQQFRIVITTSDGRKYQSDPVSGKVTPPIDSITWSQPFDLTLAVTTHDPSNKTRYYRWDYTETWQHDAALQSPWGLQNGFIIATDSTNQKSHCWSTGHSTDVIIDNTSQLNQDLVDKYPVHVIPNGDARVDLKYAIVIRQYALTDDAYTYWDLIKKTSQGLGTLFDLQPTQLLGNIHCLTNPAEPVIGYASASSIEQQRLFLYETYLTNWLHNSPGFGCDTMAIPVDRTNYFIWDYGDTTWGPYYFISSSGPLIIASEVCLDCTILGGTNTRPPNWP